MSIYGEYLCSQQEGSQSEHQSIDQFGEPMWVGLHGVTALQSGEASPSIHTRCFQQ